MIPIPTKSRIPKSRNDYGVVYRAVCFLLIKSFVIALSSKCDSNRSAGFTLGQFTGSLLVACFWTSCEQKGLCLCKVSQGLP